MLRLIDGGQRSDGGEFKIGSDEQPINTSDPDFSGADSSYVSANVVGCCTRASIYPVRFAHFRHISCKTAISGGGPDETRTRTSAMRGR
jgi:hypothetical protein